MDTILEQKRKGKEQFRVQIDAYLSESIFTRQQDQLSVEVIQQIFASSPKQGTFLNGKISLDKLMENIYDSGSHFNTKQFSKIFVNKKQIRPQQIFQILKSHDLTQFDLEEEIIKNFFQDQKFSVKKLDKIMKELGLKELNKKDKQIMIECFDYDRDNIIKDRDLQVMLNKAVQLRAQKSTKTKNKRLNVQNAVPNQENTKQNS